MTAALPRVCVPDETAWQPSLGAYFHTGIEAVLRVAQLPYGTAVAIDIETPSVTDSFTIKCVTASWVQDGDTHAVLLDPSRDSEHAGAVRAIADRAQWLILHGSPFDMPGLVAAELVTLEQLDKVMDTLIYARSAWPDQLVLKRLEILAGSVLGMPQMVGALKLAQKASGLTSNDKWYSQGDIHIPVYRHGAMADTLVTLRLAHPLFEAAVERQLNHPFAHYGCTTREAAAALVLREQAVNRIMLRRACRGLEVDLEYLDTYVDSVQAEKARAVRVLTDAGLRPGNGLDVIKKLEADGALPANWPRTRPSPTRPEGTLKSDKETMELLPEDHPLGSAHHTVAHTDKILGYMEKTVARSRVTGRLHPQFNILGASATGRMCLPVSHNLVTQRGIVASDDIRIGDLTIDKSGEWVPVTAVHRYSDATIHTRTWRNFTMSSTPEHRWVTKVDGGNVRVEPITGVRRRVILTPLFHGEFSPKDRTFRDRGERIAALIGMLVSDGRCAVTGNELRAYVYQTEGGFYKEFLRMIPSDAVMYDRVTAETGRGPHHEIRIKIRWLRPILSDAGLRVDTTLSRSEDLINWVAGLNMNAVRAFLQAVYLSDGNTSQGVGQITCEHPETQRAIQLAAYRLGWRSYIRTSPPSKWGTKPRMNVHLTQQAVWIRDTPVAESTGNVWCVSTASGTFTAWNGAPYLTGNSASEPEVQQFPAAARPIIRCDAGSAGLQSIDWSSIEPALMSWMAKDWDFITPYENGADIYAPVVASMGVARKIAKVVVLADMYGRGVTSTAAKLRVDTDRVKELKRKMHAAMPVTARFMRRIKAVAEDTGLAITVSGRVLTIPKTNGIYMGYKAVNYGPGQGSCYDLVANALIEMDRRGISDHVLLPMHDELVVSAEVAAEVQEVMEIAPPELITWTGGRVPRIRTDSQFLGRVWTNC